MTPVACRRGAVRVCRRHCGGRRRPARGVLTHAAGGNVGLRLPRGEPLTVRKHHRTERGGDQQCAGELEGKDVLAEQELGQTVWVAVAVGDLEPDNRTGDRLTDRQHCSDSEYQADRRGQEPLTLDRLLDCIRRLNAHQHEDEQEEHHDGTGVDNDLNNEQEWRTLSGIEHGETDHHNRQAQRSVHGLLGEHQPKRGDHHDWREEPERRHFSSPPTRWIGSSLPR